MLITCPYLNAEVELTEERERHIAEHHPDLLPSFRQCIIDTIEKPDRVRRGRKVPRERLFSRWFSDVRNGKYVVVVVVSDSERPPRHWIVTAYLARRLAEGENEWPPN